MNNRKLIILAVVGIALIVGLLVLLGMNAPEPEEPLSQIMKEDSTMKINEEIEGIEIEDIEAEFQAIDNDLSQL